MNREEIAAFAEASAGAPRLIGLDLGTKTIGLALSDVGRQIASPLETIRRVKFTPDAAQAVARPSVASAYGWGSVPMMSLYDAETDLPVIGWNETV